MLQVTPRAATVLKDARSQQGLPDQFGLRVHPQRPDRRHGIRLKFIAEPLEGDETAESDGLRVFVSPDLAEALADQTIDTQATGPNLVLRDQAKPGLR